MGAHAQLRCGKAVSRFVVVAEGTKTAEVVLVRCDIATIVEEACFLECLAEGDVGTYALAAGFLVVEVHNVFYGAVEFRVCIVLLDEGDHLLLCGFGWPEDGDGGWIDVGIHKRDIIEGLGFPVYLTDGFGIDFAGHLRGEVRTVGQGPVADRCLGGNCRWRGRLGGHGLGRQDSCHTAKGKQGAERTCSIHDENLQASKKATWKPCSLIFIWSG